MADSKEAQTTVYDSTAHSSEVKLDGSLEFVHEYGGNESKPSYQEASGAPVENVSPLGLHVTGFTTIFLNIGMMIGTGVFSTRKCFVLCNSRHSLTKYPAASILKGTGSVGLSLLYWALGLAIAGAQLAIYMELASYFPNRSGAEVVYLEQAYPRPKYLLPTAFAVQSVLLSFSSSNCIGTNLPRTETLRALLTMCHSHGAVSISHRWSYAFGMGTEGTCSWLYHFYCVV